MARLSFPRSILEFQERFGDEEACWEYLVASRWLDGFVCPRCAGQAYWPVRSRRLLECAGCGHQASVTAGTVMHKTRLPLRSWFWAAYLVATQTPGMSARQLQLQLALSRYDTAWTMLHKLRAAMVNAERSQLTGEVEVDEFEVGGVQHGRRAGRLNDSTAAHGIIACEIRGTGSGRIRMEAIADASGPTLTGFVERNVESGAVVHTDAWQGYAPLRHMGYQWAPRSERKARREGATDPILPRAHRAISNLKSWIRGTHRDISADHAQAYFDEFVFRYNRRRTPMAAFQTLLGLSSAHQPITRTQIISQERPRRDLS